MKQRLAWLCICLIGVMVWWSPPALAITFPDPPTAVLDLAAELSLPEQVSLDQQLNQLEADTGWKLRVLTQFDEIPGIAVKNYWGLDDHSVLLVADTRGGNLLAFNVGDAVRPILPRTFWVELQSRFGNQFYVRDHGEDLAIQATVDTLEYCFRQNGCRVVPGLPDEQWVLTLVCSLVGGLVCGFAGKPRHEGELFSWQWALIFSPLWLILFVAFGLGPVVTRTQDWLPILRNCLGFGGGIVAIYLLPQPQRNQAKS